MTNDNNKTKNSWQRFYLADNMDYLWLMDGRNAPPPPSYQITEAISSRKAASSREPVSLLSQVGGAIIILRYLCDDVIVMSRLFSSNRCKVVPTSYTIICIYPKNEALWNRLNFLIFLNFSRKAKSECVNLCFQSLREECCLFRKKLNLFTRSFFDEKTNESMSTVIARRNQDLGRY